uniref:Odorant receptor n=1 Tax=Plectus sambesii TaxID=2011161 RepID=A0A914WUN0_9BILA
MKFVGLDHTFCRPAFRPFFKIYSVAVFLLQVAGVICILALIDPPNEGLKTTTTLKICSIIYLSIGATSTILLYIFQGKLPEVRDAIVRELPEGHELPYHNSLLRISRILVVCSIAFSLLNAGSLLSLQLGLVKMPLSTIFFSRFPYNLLDIVLIWFTQNSQMMAGSILVVLCLGIRKSVIQIGDDMIKEADCDILYYQRRYQAMTDATSLLEESYSLFILFVYAVSVPVCAFILYTILRGDDMSVIGGIILLSWGFNIIICLLYVSIPSILLYEQGDVLLRSCYQMYNKYASAEGNTMVFQQNVRFLASQITATPLSMSAGNFFILSREMLLTLFSQILTYFIIILQS